MLIVANICFYDMEHIVLYQGMCIFAMMVMLYTAVRNKELHFGGSRGVLYLTVLYTMYTIYGLFFLRADTYNDDRLIFTFIQCVLLYISFRHLLLSENWLRQLSVSFVISGLFCIAYIIAMEKDMIFVSQVEERIGDTLSGNVNTIGFSLGMLSYVVTYLYAKTKSKFILFVLLGLMAMMLLTGSKKTVIIIFLDIFTYYIASKERMSSFIKVLLFGSFIIWLIKDSPYFYEVIGKRIDDMFSTFTGDKLGDYSYSTESREGMIQDGFRLFQNYPIFGGGMNYFAFASVKYGHFGYSHCNYTELLCNFGLFGFLLYYIPYIKNIASAWRIRNRDRDKSMFIIFWLIMGVILGWAMVQFSELCIDYFPIIVSFALLDNLKSKNNYVKTKNIQNTLENK